MIKKNSNKETPVHSMVIEDATIEEICNIISGIKNTKAAGIDGVIIEHIKGSKFNSSIMISKLIEKIVQQEKWPSELKIQVLRPVYKKGIKNDINNYRPLSLLPQLDKIIEKCFANHITDFLNENKLLNKNQYGFRNKCGTHTILQEVNDKVTAALNSGMFVGTILIDLSRAFDTINYDILLKKM